MWRVIVSARVEDVAADTVDPVVADANEQSSVLFEASTGASGNFEIYTPRYFEPETQ
jgi:hypothetical protein